MKFASILFLAFALILCTGYRDVERTQIAVKIDSANMLQVFIPVTVADTTVYMLWDTGCSRTTIRPELAERVNVKPDTSRNHRIYTWTSRILGESSAGVEHGLSDTIVNMYETKRLLKFTLGDKKVWRRPIIDAAIDEPAVNILGNDVMGNYYYAIDFPDRRMILSDTPLIFSQYDIADSVEFVYHLIDSLTRRRLQYNVLIYTDSLHLILDTGMIQSMRYKDNAKIYYDIILASSDSLDRMGRLYKKINERFQFHMKMPLGEKGNVGLAYGDSICVNSYPITAYFPYVCDKKYADRANDGFIALSFLLRFDMAYYDCKTRNFKLYKFRNSRSLLGDVPLSEFIPETKNLPPLN